MGAEPPLSDCCAFETRQLSSVQDDADTAPRGGDGCRGHRSIAVGGYPPGMKAASAPLRLRSADLHWRAVEGEVLALDARTALYLAVNRAGALLWELLARGTSRAELVER